MGEKSNFMAKRQSERTNIFYLYIKRKKKIVIEC